MPYIKSEDRVDLLSDYKNPETAGELNYLITTILLDYMENKGKSYQTFNDISGAMTECLAEFRRRVIAPYEDEKIKQNGDVY